jgi:hypothetical protein
LAINITDGKLYYKDNSGTVKLLASNASTVSVDSISFGSTGLTPSTATTGVVTVAGTLATTNGGTGLTSFTSGGVVYASSTSALATSSGLTFSGGILSILTANSQPFGISSSNASSTLVQHTNSNAIADLFYRFRQNGGGGNFWDMTMEGSTNGFTFDYNDSEKLRITSAGNLGLGFSSISAVSGLSSSPVVAQFGNSSSGNGQVIVGTAAGGFVIDQSNAGNTTTTLRNIYGATSALAKLNLESGVINFKTGTSYTQAMVIDASQNMGLGVTPSASSWKTIEIGYAGNTLIGGGLSDFRMLANSYYNAGFKYGGTGLASQYAQSSGVHSWYTAASGTAGNAITFTQAMTLDANGNLLVGTTTPTATSKIYAAGAVSTASQIDMRVADTTNTSYIQLMRTGATYSYAGMAGNEGAVYSTTSLNLVADSSGVIKFSTSTTERLRIASTGAFGLSGANYGTSGQVLTSGGSAAAPTWTTVAAGSAATPTALGTVYGATSSGSPYLTALGYAAGGSNTGVSNTAIGYQAGTNTTSGTYNVSVGQGALQTNVTGSNNIAIGRNAVSASTVSDNVGIGFNALSSTSTGANNVGVGSYVLTANTTGASNAAVGYQALYANTTGTENAAFGFRALYSSTSGSGNVAIGRQALVFNTTGAQNTAVGLNALYANTSAQNNTAIGYAAMETNTTGYNNTAVGYQALYSNTTGDTCAAFGHSALRSHTTGYYNVAVGPSALYSDTTGAYNNAFGYQALYSVTTGEANCAFGSASLKLNTASQNSAFGHGTLQANTTGTRMTAVGNNALATNTTGTQNTGIGQEALVLNTTGSYNVAVGYGSLRESTTGANNVAVGKAAGYSVTTGYVNTLIGNEAGNNGSAITTGAYNTLIGQDSRVNTGADNFCIVICSATATGKGSSTGFINPNTGSMYQGNNSATWAVTSDQRLKKNIVDNTIGLGAITSIRVRNFEYRLPEEVDAELKSTDAIEKTGVQLGVIAQELQAVLPECVKTESSGVLSVNSDNLIWYAINAIKELKAQNDSLKARLDAANL